MEYIGPVFNMLKSILSSYRVVILSGKTCFARVVCHLCSVVSKGSGTGSLGITIAAFQDFLPFKNGPPGQQSKNKC